MPSRKDKQQAPNESVAPEAEEKNKDAGEPVEKDAKDAPEKKEDTGDAGYVDYMLPFLPGKRIGDSQTVTINGKNYQVMYGKSARVPKGVAEILDEMVRQNEMIEKKIKALLDEQCIAKFDKG